MPKVFYFPLAFFIFFSAAELSWALRPYGVIDALLPQDNHPRVLNTDDLSQLDIHTPLPLLSPVGDFNHDGVEDIAISGVFDLVPEGELKYFLLVGTRFKNPTKFKELYYQKYDGPVFLHIPGTTGPDDPKNQAFSISFCINCTRGFDFFWDKKSSSFLKKRWEDRPKVTASPKEEEPQVPEDEVEKALKIVSPLKDVDEFISELKKRKGQLVVKINPTLKKPKPHQYLVKIAEKKEAELILFDQILVDTRRMKVIQRRVKP